jgi:hypothetical protein
MSKALRQLRYKCGRHNTDSATNDSQFLTLPLAEISAIPRSLGLINSRNSYRSQVNYEVYVSRKSSIFLQSVSMHLHCGTRVPLTW